MTVEADGPRPPEGPAPPPGCLVYAVGDIHGCTALLDDLIAQIVDDAEADEAERRVLVFLGDYIDRGPDSAGVIERLSDGLPGGFGSIFLKGNHEALLLDFLARPEQLDLWLHNGADATLASYGIDANAYSGSRHGEIACMDAFAERLPAHHLRFFESLRLSATLGDYFFAHAGVDPVMPLDRQRPEDLMWIRHRFLESDRDFGKFVIHGHTPVSEPDVRANRINIDTGACMRGTLTALRLQGTARRFLATAPW